MGQEVGAKVFSREDRQRYREKVRRCLDVFARMLAEARFDGDRRSVGLEIELNLTDEAGDPAFTQRRRARAHRRPGLRRPSSASSTSRSTSRRGCSRAAALRELEETVRAQPQPRRGARPRARATT